MDATRSMQYIIKHRHTGFTFQPYLLRVPHSSLLDKKSLTQQLHEFIRCELHTYPQWLQNVHVGKARTIILKNKNIGDHLVNMRKHAILTSQESPACTCCTMRAKFPHIDFPVVGGHIFFTGDEYHGPHAHILTQNSNNIPVQSTDTLTSAIVTGFRHMVGSHKIPDAHWDECTLTKMAMKCNHAKTWAPIHMDTLARWPKCYNSKEISKSWSLDRSTKTLASWQYVALACMTIA